MRQCECVSAYLCVCAPVLVLDFDSFCSYSFCVVECSHLVCLVYFILLIWRYLQTDCNTIFTWRLNFFVF